MYDRSTIMENVCLVVQFLIGLLDYFVIFQPIEGCQPFANCFPLRHMEMLLITHGEMLLSVNQSAGGSKVLLMKSLLFCLHMRFINMFFTKMENNIIDSLVQ